MSLLIKNLSASFEEKEILKGVDLEILPGKVYVLMGPNGSGKSTLAQALMGNENYESRIMNHELRINGDDISNLKTDERARKGLFLAFQNPLAIPGVTVGNLLKNAYQNIHGVSDGKKRKLHNPALSVWDFNKMLVSEAKNLGISQEFLGRSINDGFSGGERKKMEMLQSLVLKPKYAVFDEIDTGLDVDALKVVAEGINKLKKQGSGVLIITHYQRILKYIRPDVVYVLVKGKIVTSGDHRLAQEIEKNGYKKWT